MARYEGALPPAPASRGVEEAPQEELEKLAALDEMVTGTDRRNLLFRLFAEQPRTLYVRGDKHRAAGFLASRPGTLAVHLGPCMAVPEAGPLLFAEAWHRWAGQRVFLDVPVANQEATRWAEAAGLTVQCLSLACAGASPCASASTGSGPAPGRKKGRKQGSGVRGQGSGVRGQGSGVRGQGSGVRGQGSGVRGQGSGVRGRGSGVRGQGSGVRGQGSGVRGQGSGVRGQGSGVGGRGSGVRGQGSGVRAQSVSEEWDA